MTSSERVGVDSELELIRARARALASRINRDLAYANLQASVARLYNSVGYDAVPRDDEAKSVEELAQLIDARFDELENASFARRAAIVKPTVAAGMVTGAQPRIGKLVQQGLGKALQNAGFGGSEDADLRLDLRIALDRPKDGLRTARITVSALPRNSFIPTLTREFRTTLSDPVTDGQWRALGEGAVYKVATQLSSKRITTASLRVAERLDLSGKRSKSFPSRPIEALPLRMDAVLTPAGRQKEAAQ
jgi:hypothetical protein